MVILDLLQAGGIQALCIVGTSSMFKLLLMIVSNVWSRDEGIASQRWQTVHQCGDVGARAEEGSQLLQTLALICELR